MRVRGLLHGVWASFGFTACESDEGSEGGDETAGGGGDGGSVTAEA